MAEQGMSSESMMRQAQHIWSMLDDMASNDPAAYRRFIDKHMKEGQEAMKPPEPHMCIKTRTKKSKDLFIINVCSWNRIPEPKTDQDPIPVMGGALYQPEQVPGSAQAVAVAFNPKILEEIGIDSQRQEEQDMLINLAIDYIQDQHKIILSRSYTLLPKGSRYKGSLQQLTESFHKQTKAADQQFEKDLDEIEKSFGPMAAGCKDSLLNQLSNLSTGDNQSNSSTQTASQSSGLSHSVPEPQIKLPGGEPKPKKDGLIEEIHKQTLTEPEYSVEKEESGGACTVIVRVQLPGVLSVAECELDVSQYELHLLVPDKYELNYTFTNSVDQESVKAKFFKKSSVVSITLNFEST